MLSYPGLQSIGKLKPGYTWQRGCSDNVTGYVYFEADPTYDYEELVEYPIGGTSQVGVLQPPAGYDYAYCSADPTTGNLAVITISTPSEKTGYVTVFPAGSGEPQTFSNPAFKYYFSCVYDAAGNLFVLGETPTSGYAALAELPKGTSTFVNLSLNKHIGLDFLQWDGHYIVSQSQAAHNESPLTMYRISVSGSTATVAGMSKFKHAKDTGWIQGDTMIATEYGKPNVGNLVFYKYPKGGKPTKVYQSKPRATVFNPFVATAP